MVNIKQLESDVNFLKEYYHELNELKTIGIDLTRMDAHNRLVTFVMETLFETYGVDKTVEIMRYAENPIITFDELLCTLYPPTAEKPELTAVSNNYDAGKDMSASCTPPTKDDIVFHVNGRPVNKSEYDAALKIVEDIFGKLF